MALPPGLNSGTENFHSILEYWGLNLCSECVDLHFTFVPGNADFILIRVSCFVFFAFFLNSCCVSSWMTESCARSRSRLSHVLLKVWRSSLPWPWQTTHQSPTVNCQKDFWWVRSFPCSCLLCAPLPFQTWFSNCVPILYLRWNNLHLMHFFVVERIPQMSPNYCCDKWGHHSSAYLKVKLKSNQTKPDQTKPNQQKENPTKESCFVQWFKTMCPVI